MTEVKRRGRPPKVSSESQKELEKLDKTFEEFNENNKKLELERNKTPAHDPMQTQMSQKEIKNANDVYLKPNKTISSRQKFNEKYREKYNYIKEYVKFIAENKEIIGESIEMWTRPIGGMPAEFWVVPVNKPIWGPRYLAEQIKKKYYHRLVMEDVPRDQSGVGTFYGSMAADSTIQRLDAHPVGNTASVFMGG